MKPVRIASLCFLAAIALACLCSCKPWTVVSIQANDADQAPKSAANPAAYANSVWNTKLLPYITQHGTEARTLLDALKASPDGAAAKYGHREAGGALYYTVRGVGRVVSAETESRNRLIYLDIAPFDGRPDVSIQVGPVLRGTALRDSTSAVQFTDFTNQLQFADVGNELNALALKNVLPSITPERLRGAKVSFAGAFAWTPGDQPPIHGVVPVFLETEAQP